MKTVTDSDKNIKFKDYHHIRKQKNEKERKKCLCELCFTLNPLASVSFSNPALARKQVFWF